MYTDLNRVNGIIHPQITSHFQSTLVLTERVRQRERYALQSKTLTVNKYPLSLGPCRARSLSPTCLHIPNLRVPVREDQLTVTVNSVRTPSSQSFESLRGRSACSLTPSFNKHEHYQISTTISCIQPSVTRQFFFKDVDLNYPKICAMWG